MYKKLTIFVMSVFFVTLAAIILQVNVNKPRILVLHSYSNDYVWTREVNVGLERVFGIQHGVEIRFHEMSTKKHSGKDYKRRAGIAARTAIEKIRPNILIAVDDDAQKYAAKHYLNDPNMKIVFAGINGSPKPYGYLKANNVTGILERKPAKALKEVVMMLSKDMDIRGRKPRAVFLADKSHSTKRDGGYLDTFDWGNVEYLGRQAVGTFADWKKSVASMSDKADFILVGGYRKLLKSTGSKDFVKAKEVMSWTEKNSLIPVIGMNIFNSKEGAMLSVGVSPFEQGEVAATMAMQLIHGTDIKSLPIKTSSQYIIAVWQAPSTLDTFQRIN